MKLEIDKISVFIKNSHILRNVSIEINEKEMVCLIGRNGAGKTITLNTVMGFLAPRSGAVRFKGHDITRLPPNEIARMGIGFAPEDSGVFGGLTTFENIEIASWMRESSRNFWRISTESFDSTSPATASSIYLNRGPQTILSNSTAIYWT